MKKMIVFLFFLFLIFFLELKVYAQSTSTFQKVFNLNSSANEIRAIESTYKNDYFLAGNSGKKFYLLKVDELGNKVYFNSYQNSMATITCRGMKLTKNQNSVLLFGESLSSYQELLEFILVSVDLNGNLLWAKKYGISTINETRDFAIATDGYFLIGKARKNCLDQGNIVILKVDNSGDFIWAKSFGDDYEDDAFSIITLSDGGCLVTGKTSFSDDSEYDSFLALIRLGPNGETLWKKIYNTRANVSVVDMLEVEDQNFLIYGMLDGEEKFSFLAKINSSGFISWVKGFRDLGVEKKGKMIFSTPDYNYLLAGDYKTASQSDICLSKMDKTGNFIWSRTYGDNNINHCRSLSLANDKGFILTGINKGFSLQDESNIYLIKTNTEGNTFCDNENTVFIKNHDLDFNLLNLDLKEENLDVFYFYPTEIYTGSGKVEERTICSVANELEVKNNVEVVNTTENSLMIKTDQPGYLKICDISGKEIMTREVSAGDTEVSFKELGPGVYFYTFKSGGKTLDQGKFIIN